MKRHINEDDAKRVILPNAKEGIEKREEEQCAKKLISSMSPYYDSEDFWDVMGMVMFTSKKEFIIKDYPDIPFKLYMVYSNVNNKLSIRYKINADEDFNSIQYGHRWLDVRNIKIGNVYGLLKKNGFLPPSLKKIAEVNGNDIFDNLRTDLSKYGYDNSNDTEEIPNNIIKMNVKENRNMNKKQIIRINENQLKRIVTESVKRVLNESLEKNEIINNLEKLEDDLVSVASEIKDVFFRNERYFDNIKRFERLGLNNPPYSYGTQGELSYSFDSDKWNEFTKGKGIPFEEELQNTYKWYNTLMYYADCEGYGYGAASRGFDVTSPIGLLWQYASRAIRILNKMAEITGTKIDKNITF